MKKINSICNKKLIKKILVKKQRIDKCFNHIALVTNLVAVKTKSLEMSYVFLLEMPNVYRQLLTVKSRLRKYVTNHIFPKITTHFFDKLRCTLHAQPADDIKKNSNGFC